MILDLTIQQNIYYVLGCFAGSFLIAFFIFPSFIKELERNNIVDVPDHRKIHEKNVPGLGGVVVFLAMIIAVGFSLPMEELSKHRLFLGSLVLVFIVGIRDDIIPLRPSLKLLSQIIPVFIVFWLEDIRITSLYSVWNIEFGFILSALITCFTVVIVTNSFNLIDGIDGLLGSLSLVSIGAYATYFYVTDNFFYTFVLVALAGSIIAFLIFNWSPAKIFLGDNGALIIGFILSFVSIVFINDNYNKEVPIFRSSVGTAMCFIAVPLYDMFRIIGLRLRNGRRLMVADKNHMHHLLLDLGLSHHQITILLFLVQASLVLVAFLGKNLAEPYLFGILAVVMFGLNGLIVFRIRRKTQTEKT